MLLGHWAKGLRADFHHFPSHRLLISRCSSVPSLCLSHVTVSPWKPLSLAKYGSLSLKTQFMLNYCLTGGRSSKVKSSPYNVMANMVPNLGSYNSEVLLVLFFGKRPHSAVQASCDSRQSICLSLLRARATGMSRHIQLVTCHVLILIVKSHQQLVKSAL